MPDPWLRRSFFLEKDVEQARVYVASMGYHELYVNNQKIGDTVLMPSVASHKERARYVTKGGYGWKSSRGLMTSWLIWSRPSSKKREVGSGIFVR